MSDFMNDVNLKSMIKSFLPTMPELPELARKAQKNQKTENPLLNHLNNQKSIGVALGVIAFLGIIAVEIAAKTLWPRFTGERTITLPNGTLYTGVLGDNKFPFIANGTLPLASGAHYEGGFDEGGYQNGPGKITWPNGTIVEGIWKKDNMAAEVLKHEGDKWKLRRVIDNSIYDGKLNGQLRPTGNATITLPGGAVYTGTVKPSWSQFQETGILRDANGKILKLWRNGIPDTIYRPKGNKWVYGGVIYEGKLDDQLLPTGNWTITTVDKAICTGKLILAKNQMFTPEGIWTKTFANGNVYTGTINWCGDAQIGILRSASGKVLHAYDYK